MAYVHRSFGSKEKLFYEAVKASGKPGLLFAEEGESLPSSLAKQVLSRKGVNEIGALDLVVQSFGSPAASVCSMSFSKKISLLRSSAS